MGADDMYEAAAAHARLLAWFEAEGPLVMDEADFDDVQTVMVDYGRVLVENEQMRQELERLTSRTVTCPACQRPTKLTATGLLRFHGPHSRPCRASGTPSGCRCRSSPAAARTKQRRSRLPVPSHLPAGRRSRARRRAGGRMPGARSGRGES